MDREVVTKHAAAAFWHLAVTEVFTTDLGTKFPWAGRHAMYMAMDKLKRRLLIAVDDADAAVLFEPTPDVTRLDQARFNFPDMNAILAAEGVALPSGLDLPWTARSMLAGLGGWVATKAFWDEQKVVMAMWSTRRPQDGPTIFKQHCRDPVLVTKPDGDWTMEFSYFNLSGGVEEWALAGNPHEVRTASAKPVVPNGTFVVPYM